MYFIIQIGLARTQMTFVECLVYGSLISATDPVSVLSILKEIGYIQILIINLIISESISIYIPMFLAKVS